VSPRPTRRELLALAPAAVLLAACSEAADPAPVDPDDALRAAAAERERALLARYDAVLAAVPELSARLLPVRGHHAEHLQSLVGPPASDRPSPTTGPAADVPPPADAAAALTGLVTAERTAGTAHATDCLAARSRSLAAVLASLSASELSHPVALA
jgi:hypothetical protein